MSTTPNALGTKLKDQLAVIYPDVDGDALTDLVLEAFWPDGRRRRQRPRRPSNGPWSEKDAVVITYGNTITGEGHPLAALRGFLDDGLRGVVDWVHMLPFFPSSSDDGFSVIDHREVDPALGDWGDVRRIGERFGLMSDLVLNHVSAKSRWFEAYRAGTPPFDEFFVEVSPDDDLSAVVRPRTSPLLREVDTVAGPRHVWCTFSHDQVDLNFANPEVLLEMLRVLRFHIDQGTRIIRLDAVAFLWKEPGTSSIHLPQTHAIVKLMRALADYATETVILLTETNVPKAENLSYFGRRDEAHMVYNFPLPPLVLHAVLSGDVRHLRTWLRSMPPAPLGCAYFNFTASHDGIGMRPAEGVLPPEEIARTIDTVRDAGGLVSMRSLPDGTESPYELNAGFFDAVTATFDGDRSSKVERFLCSQTVVMSIEGIPAFYLPAIVGTPNDHEAVALRGMHRAINRHVWRSDELRTLLDDPSTDQARVFSGLRDLLRLRSRQPAFHPNATQHTLQLEDRVLGVWRQSLDRHQSIFALHNVSAETVEVDAFSLNLIDDEAWLDLITGDAVDPDGTIALAPYQCRWVSNLG